MGDRTIFGVACRIAMRAMVSSSFSFISVGGEGRVSYEPKGLTRNAGLLNHNWSDYRNTVAFEAGIGQMITASSS